MPQTAGATPAGGCGTSKPVSRILFLTAAKYHGDEAAFAEFEWPGNASNYQEPDTVNSTARINPCGKFKLN
jgi:hypothetical protein